MILPYIDNAAIYNKLDFDQPWALVGTDLQPELPIYRCPSDPGSLTIGAPPLVAEAARACYPAVSGANRITNSTVFVSETGGPFGENSFWKFDDFQDGLSNTFLVGERRSNNPDRENPGGETIWAGVRDDHTKQGQAFAIGDCSRGNLLNFRGASRSGVTGFSSFHKGGAHFLIGDGSVRFISDNIDSATYARLATIADGGSLGDW